MATHKATSLTIDEYEFPRGARGLATVVGAALVVLSSRRQFIEPRSGRSPFVQQAVALGHPLLFLFHGHGTVF